MLGGEGGEVRESSEPKNIQNAKCTGMVKVVTHTIVWWKVLMAFLHNHAAESHEILSECSHH